MANKTIYQFTENDAALLTALGSPDAVVYEIPISTDSEQTTARFAISTILNQGLINELGVFGKNAMNDPKLFSQALKSFAETQEIWGYKLETGMLLMTAAELSCVDKKSVDMDGFFTFGYMVSLEDFTSTSDNGPGRDLEGRTFDDYIVPATANVLELSPKEMSTARYFVSDSILEKFRLLGKPNMTIEMVLEALQTKQAYAFKVDLDDTDLEEDRYIVCTKKELKKLRTEHQLIYRSSSHGEKLPPITCFGKLLFEFTTQVSQEQPLSFESAPQKHINNALYCSLCLLYLINFQASKLVLLCISFHRDNFI
ncbi:MAG: hypothetical protein HGA85_02285 [Nanoarchaeota archaeon]|nr:hypothetical protein [Nanoarchaeota archaeon]